MNDTKKIIIDISFDSDGYKLNGKLHLPENSLPPVVIGSHGLVSNGDSMKQIALAEKCSSMGIAFFRFHHRGCGTSEGAFEKVTNLKNRCVDLKNAVKSIISRNDIGNKFGLFGSSFGGTTCLSTGQEINPHVFVIAAAPVRSKTLKKAPETTETKAVLTPEFYKKNLAFDVSNKINGLKNMIIFHGDADDIVPVENGYEIFESVREPKKIVIQKGCGHTMEKKEHQSEFIEKASRWIVRFLI